MRVVILCGGRGTRLQEETVARPKPMVEIGGQPILWHIMKHYTHHGFREFVIALGYLGDYVKDYFVKCLNISGNLTVDFGNHTLEREHDEHEDWLLHLIDTGVDTLTGGRIRRLQPWLADDTFMVTYGDGVSNIDLPRLLAFHRWHGKLATVTAVRPPARFGSLILDGDRVSAFSEKRLVSDGGWINGGFLVLEPRVFDYLQGDMCSLEGNTLAQLADDGQLFAYRHEGFWQCMDTLREKHFLEALWQQNEAPWKTWDAGGHEQPRNRAA